jgi:hypothetical protein
LRSNFILLHPQQSRIAAVVLPLREIEDARYFVGTTLSRPKNDARFTPAVRFVPKEAVSSSALLTAAVLTATLLARAVLIALLFPLTAFTFLFFAV